MAIAQDGQMTDLWHWWKRTLTKWTMIENKGHLKKQTMESSHWYKQPVSDPRWHNPQGKISFPKFMEMNRSCERPLIASPSLLDPGFYTWLSTANEKEHADPWKRGIKPSLEIHTKKLLFLLLQRQSLKQSCCSSAKPGKGRCPLHFSFLSTSSTTLWWRGGRRNFE